MTESKAKDLDIMKHPFFWRSTDSRPSRVRPTCPMAMFSVGRHWPVLDGWTQQRILRPHTWRERNVTTAIARITACLPILAALLSTPAWADSMQFTNFDGPGNNGGGTTVNAINNNGAVVGFSTNNASTPTLFTNFIRNPNGTFTTLNVNNDPLANANGINDNNVVVGASNNNAFSLGTTFTTLPPAKP